MQARTHACTQCDTHILIPFEDRKPTGLKVDIAPNLLSLSQTHSLSDHSTDVCSPPEEEKNLAHSILDPNTQKVQKNTICKDQTQHANFQGNPLYEAAKQHLNNS